MENNKKKPDILAGYVQPNLWQLLLCTLTMNVLSLALPLMTLQIYDRILPNKSLETLSVLVAGVCVALALEAALKIGRAALLGWNGAAFEHQVSCDVIRHILQADLMLLEKTGTGAYLQHMSSIPRLKFFYNGEIFTALLEGAFIAVFWGMIVYIGGWVAVIPLIVLGIFAGICLLYSTSFNQQLIERTQCDDQRYNFLVQTLNGVHTLKAFGLEQPFQRRYEHMEARSSSANLLSAQTLSSLFNTSTMMSSLMVAAILTVGALMAFDGNLSTGALVACILLSGRMMQPLQRLLQLWVRYHDFELVQKQIQHVLSMPTVKPAKTALPAKATDGLVLDGVSFQYPSMDEPLVNEVSLHVEKGQSVAIHGRDGSGKSTLLKLIAGIYSPQKGHVFVNGLQPQELSARSLAHSVGLLSSNGAIFRGTIRNNLTCFGEIDEAAAFEMAQMLGVKDDVARLPAGYDTPLEGTSADSIAPGLKQRIVLARVLASKPDVLLFDNADQALDQHGYQLLQTVLAGLRDTTAMVIVSEDIAFTQLADRQLMMYQGRLLAQVSKNTQVKPSKSADKNRGLHA